MDKKEPKFYELPVSSRLDQLAREADLPLGELLPLDGMHGLTPEIADHMIENAVGVFGLPLGIARNFIINGREVLVPMAIEEPSVVAGASFMAKLAQAGGGFQAETTAPEMIGQLQLLDVQDLAIAKEKILAHREELLALAGTVDPVLSSLGGGPRDIEVREITRFPHRTLPGAASYLRRARRHGRQCHQHCAGTARAARGTDQRRPAAPAHSLQPGGSPTGARRVHHPPRCAGI